MVSRVETRKKKEILLMSSSSSYTDEQYGAVFDISKPSDTDDNMWCEIKITFVKADISQTEYLTYDKTVSNLYDSVEEILNSLKRFLDRTNLHIVHMYLLDVTRSEYMVRISNLPIFQSLRPLIPRDVKYKRKENTDLRLKYKELGGAEIGHQLIQLMKAYEANDYGDSLADALNLVFMQKLVISLLMHQVACEHAMMSMRKSLDVPLSEEEVKKPIRKSDNTVEIEMKINEIITKKDKGRDSRDSGRSSNREKVEESKKFSFRDACECVVV